MSLWQILLALASSPSEQPIIARSVSLPTMNLEDNGHYVFGPFSFSNQCVLCGALERTGWDKHESIGKGTLAGVDIQIENVRTKQLTTQPAWRQNAGTRLLGMFLHAGMRGSASLTA